MIRTDKKAIIFVGKQTINVVCFSLTEGPKNFKNKTLDPRVTESFLKENRPNEEYLKALVDEINAIVEELEGNNWQKSSISIYASQSFMSLQENDRILLTLRLFHDTGINAYILSQQLERLFIGNLVPTYTESKYIIRISTDSIVIYYLPKNEAMGYLRISEVGSAKLVHFLQDSSIIEKLQDPISDNEINKLIDKIAKKLRSIIQEYNHQNPSRQFHGQNCRVIYLGGEINFMKKFDYELDDNKEFSDPDHPYSISYKQFYNQSIDKIFKKKQSTIETTDSSGKSGWSAGIKPCTLLALSLFKVLNVDVVIPSDKKELHGMFYKNYENVVLTGSKRYNGEEIEEWIDYFKLKNVKVSSPILQSKQEEFQQKINHLQAINDCDTLIVCNSAKEGYIGESTLFDIGYALSKGKRVISTVKPSDEMSLFRIINIETGIFVPNEKNIVIIGSFQKFYQEICSAIKEFEEHGIHVLSPKDSYITENRDGFVYFHSDDSKKTPVEIQNIVFENIEKADVVYVWNQGGYIGPTTSYEIGMTNGKKPIYYKEALGNSLAINVAETEIMSPQELINKLK